MAALGLFHLFFFYTHYTAQIDHKIYDLLKPKTPQRNVASVVIVDIDEKSLDALGQWPWSRLVVTQLVQKIAQQHPANIGLDIIFPEPDRTSPKTLQNFYDTYLDLNVTLEGLPETLYDNDRLFSRVLQSSKSTLAVYMGMESGNQKACHYEHGERRVLNMLHPQYRSKEMLCNIDMLHENIASFGFINATADRDGIFRRLPLFIAYDNSTIPSFALANLLRVDAAMTVHDANTFSLLGHRVVMDDHSEVLLQFYETYPTISAVDLLQNNASPEMLRGKIVLLGTSAIGLKDAYLISDGRMLPGVMIHATMIDNLLNDQLIVAPDRFRVMNSLFSFIAAMFIFWLLAHGRVMPILLSFVAILLASLFYWYLLFSQGVYISLGYFLVPYISYFFLVSIYFIIKVDREEKAFAVELSRSQSATLDSMVLVAEMRDLETGAHIIRTKKYIRILAEYLMENNCYPDAITSHKIDLMYQTAPMHDIGKVGIPDNILQKQGKLTPDEFEIMKTHTTIGKTIIEHAIDTYEANAFLQMAYEIAYYHHEKFDGSGYPSGIKGDDIPIAARLMALADVYDALVSRRVYKEAFDIEDSENIIIAGRGTHFDPLVVDAFIVLKNDFREIAETYRDM